ncbi:glycosyltransferase [Wenxinia saemankumensis]|uniref:Glycosyltransferase involved in cell wall bisynthesis n=1 Tax=Wenxinia saemankumensis TaxID=1447782 RepID=A0A1M5ZYT0_9RHOB|nr:glycosyltransferase [Wenxinia saemankumensis]SHI29382.1 Glycosyltransferase involved in cell wall bisynthesis [Wenxinia saemankumensis]
MRIVLASAHPYLPQIVGGAQRSTHDLATDLGIRGHRVSILAGLTGAGWTGMSGRVRLKLGGGQLVRDDRLGYPVHRGWFPPGAVAELVAREAPDVALVQSGQPVPLARGFLAAGVPVVLYLRNVEAEDFGGDASELGPVHTIANSAFTADWYARNHGLAATVIHPTFRPEAYRTRTSRQVVTFINPHPLKGLHTAIGIARACPDIPFLFVDGWGLDPAEHERRDAALAGLPNVTLVPRTNDMRDVYGRTAILLVPSLWQEAFGRVAAEAQFSGIPVLASRCGGLPEAVGPGGLLVDPDAPPDVWVAALRAIWDDAARYGSLSAAAERHAARPALDRTVQMDAVAAVLEAAVAAHRRGGREQRGPGPVSDGFPTAAVPGEGAP